MEKFKILKGIVDFAESCEANGVELFYSYSPRVDMVRIMVYKGGKWTPDNHIELSVPIYFDEPEPFEQLKKIIETVIDKYYEKK